MGPASELTSALGDDQPFGVAFHNAPIGIAVVGPQGQILRVNPALCRLLGRREGELISMTAAELSHPEDRAGLVTGLDELGAADTDLLTLEIRCLHADGHFAWTLLSLSPVRDTDGAVRYFIGQFEDVSERKRAEVELEYVADHDWLTGLLNRRGLQKRLDHHVADTRGGAPRGSLLILDLDDFKYVNDTLGHQAGDRVITTVGSILRMRLRECDHLARLGGDEFAVLLPDCAGRHAVDVANDLLETLRATPTISDAHQHVLTASVGVTELDGSHASGDAALAQADLAMYVAKEAGRDGVSLWSEGSVPQRRLVERMEWVRRIEHALHGGGFTLFAQPIRSLATGEPDHFELLIRMIDDELGLVEPGDFLGTAERFDLIQRIDHFVVDQAMEIVKQVPDVRLNVNISGRSIGDDALLDILDRHAPLIPGGPERLTFEITETAAVADLADAGEFTRELRRIGYQVALDDFGQGFGSFTYLKHLDFDALKIDGEFVRGCVDNPTDRLIIEAVVRIGKGLDVRTVAECVETAEIATVVEALGVDYCQGFAVDRPRPVAEVLAEVAASAPARVA